MKVGIVTFHRAHNCGAAMQCIALISVLRKMGHEVFVVDCNNVGEGHFFPRTFNVRIWMGWVKSLVLTRARGQRLWLRYKRFMHRFFPMTKKISRGHSFPTSLERIVLGSDQVLNPDLTGRFLEIFLLMNRCPNKKKVAYAASFGVSTLSEHRRDVISAGLSGFQALGIREKSGVKICQNELHLPITPEVTIDPTLLLDGADYKPFETHVKTEGEYVLVYWIGNSTEYVTSLANRIAKLYGLKVIVASITARHDNETWKAISPDEFIYLFRCARFVVTTSFHGTSFAIINRKPFITVIPAGMNVASRITDLLGQLSLLSQIINEYDNVDDSRIGDMLNLDFSKAVRALERIRKESMHFLANCMIDTVNGPDGA